MVVLKVVANSSMYVEAVDKKNIPISNCRH
jgi:hypothetical protein